MNKAQKKPEIDFLPGMVITGKWHKTQYTIKEKLGSGAVGNVYLCEFNGQQAALKISENSASMTMEVNVLKAFEQVQGSRLGPCLLDVDDYEYGKGRVYSFYVMEYLQGESLTRFIRRQGREWIGVFMLQLLDDLERLHEFGWVFGDFKTENLLVISSPPRVRWIDVGGTTQIGRAIKEYTEFYDRGYWGMGSRKAEPSYDLFALVMVFLTVCYPKRFEKGTNPKATLLKKLDDAKLLAVYRESLKKAVMGKYQSSSQMKSDVTKVLNHIRVSRAADSPGKQGAGSMLMETGGIAAVAAFFYFSSLLL
ncbi:protein kinase domain-containing protein [Virgibacillus siamensis]|uniref:protein kinase domain-containing protein n=1 Tax=Virgibacillus siamensis TaxID=480071 RepID=UPI0009855A3D|nr:serine/threonine-protein kinase [Virgibacillus siamensis]